MLSAAGRRSLLVSLEGVAVGLALPMASFVSKSIALFVFLRGLKKKGI